MMSMMKIHRCRELLLSSALMFTILCVFVLFSNCYASERASESVAGGFQQRQQSTNNSETNGAIEIQQSESLLVANLTSTSNTKTAAAINQKTLQKQHRENGESVADSAGEGVGVDGAANSAELLNASEDIGNGVEKPTTYRPSGSRPSIAPHNSAQERERKLMNVLAARRTALGRGGFRTRIGTTGRTATIETTSKTPTDPRSVCIRNCTKNFTRRTTASCMRQCANFTRMPSLNSNTAIIVRPSSKTGAGGAETAVERDTNEILFSDESSHGLFVVAKEQNDTLNHISDADKTNGVAKIRARGKPAAALSFTTTSTSIENDDELQPYLYFGQKLPPIKPAMLTITSVSDEHPRLLEISVSLPDGTTPATTTTTKRTLSPIERSRSHYKYSMRNSVVGINRHRHIGSGRLTTALTGDAVELKTTLRNVTRTEQVTKKAKVEVKEPVSAMKIAHSEAKTVERVKPAVSSTPLIINVLSEEVEVTPVPVIKSTVTATTILSTTITTEASTTTTKTTTAPTTTTATTIAIAASAVDTTTTNTTTTTRTPTTTSTTPPTTTTTTAATSTTMTTTMTTKGTTTTTTQPTLTIPTTKPKTIIEEDTDLLRSLGPSLTQQINLDDQKNLVIFCNSTADCGASSRTPIKPTTDSYSKILRTTVLTSVRSTVHPRTTTIKQMPTLIDIVESPESPGKISITSTGQDIISTVVTDDREVSMEITRMNIVTLVLAIIGLVPLVAILLYLLRNYMLRRSVKDDEDFDVCITDQQPISPVKKIDSKYQIEEDEDEIDHHQQQKVTQSKQQSRDTIYNHRYDDKSSLGSEYNEFNRSKIRLKSLLGEGNFGQVWKAEADDLSGHFGATRIVAVKTIRACSAQVSLKDEANIMRKLVSHPNVVTLLGACVESEPHMLIMEYAMRGRLLSLLRAARSATNILPASVPGGRSLAPLSPRTLAGFALDIACGMEYIAERKIVHRDLAARNVLLDHNGVCKICDFGMSLDMDAERKRKEQEKNAANDLLRRDSNKLKFDFGGRYIMQQWQNNFGSHHQNGNHQNGHCTGKEHNFEKKSNHGHGHDTIGKRHALPIRWMAPEALQYHIFTTETDIWAFGIVLWEIATLGSTPYSHLTGREVIRRVPAGLHPELPKESRHEFYNLMSRCWHKDPNMRPSFSQSRLEITRSLHKWVDDDSAASDYMDVSGFSEDLEHGVVYFNHRISEFECEI